MHFSILVHELFVDVSLVARSGRACPRAYELYHELKVQERGGLGE